MKRKKPRPTGLREKVRVELKRVIDAEGTTSVAKQLNVSTPYISALKNTGRGVSFEFIDKLAQFGYTADFKLTRGGDTPASRDVAVDASEIESLARSIRLLHEANELSDESLQQKLSMIRETATKLAATPLKRGERS